MCWSKHGGGGGAGGSGRLNSVCVIRRQIMQLSVLFWLGFECGPPPVQWQKCVIGNVLPLFCL